MYKDRWRAIDAGVAREDDLRRLMLLKIEEAADAAVAAEEAARPVRGF